MAWPRERLQGADVANSMANLKHKAAPDDAAYEQAVAALLDEVRDREPFKGEYKTYQPFYGIGMPGWTFVRGDSPARFEIMSEAVARCPELEAALATGPKPSYVDVGCCSGFFCDAMSGVGFEATGVDVTKNFISWAQRLAQLKGQTITHLCQDAEKFLTSSTEAFDVTSSFATIQWVMAQRGYAAGVNCFKALFERTRHVCIVEMGYSTEDIYKTKILDRPSEIDKNWVLGIMKEHGNFEHVEFHSAGERGIWRDIFIGYKQAPQPAGRRSDDGRVTALTQAAGGRLKRLARRLLG